MPLGTQNKPFVVEKYFHLSMSLSTFRKIIDFFHQNTFFGDLGLRLQEGIASSLR